MKLAEIHRRLIGRPGVNPMRRDDLEFLPAALEVIETPPSPVGRLFAFLIVAFFVCAAAWSILGRVDVMATAQGRIVPSGDVKIIQPLEPGVVHAIRVQDGDRVLAGQLLVELDSAQATADQDRLTKSVWQAELDVARLTALKTTFEGSAVRAFSPLQGVPAALVAESVAAMRAQADRQLAKMAALTQQISQKRAEAAEAAAEMAKTQASIPILAEKDRIHRSLAAQGYGTRFALLDAQQQLSEAQHNVEVETQRAAQAKAAGVALERERAGAQSEYVSGVFTDLRKAQEQQNEFSQELIKARVKSRLTQLRSPITGTVQQLVIHTLGGVVTPAQRLMTVVPDTRDLVIEAQLANRDVGFVHAGQPAKVKVETFSFTRYGLISGRVLGVSRDSIASERPASTDNQTGQPAEPQSRSPSYVARIALGKTSMFVDGGYRPLQPGMAVTAEIRTGDRTIIDYLLSPLARRTQESLHER